MKVQAAVIDGVDAEWDIREVELRETDIRPGEILVRMGAAGLCHTDEHIRHGELPAQFPLVGGHEGAGVAVSVGEGVSHIKPGDHLVFTFRPSCGLCRYCVDGKAHLCTEIDQVKAGDPNPRFSQDGVALNAQSLIGTFAEHAIVKATACVVIDKDISMDVAALLGCAIPTGFGAAVHAGKVQPGDHVVVVGMGGVGTNAVQGAKVAGASTVVAVDLSPNKLALAREFGADAAFASLDEASEYIHKASHGRKPTVVILTVPVAALAAQAVSILDQGGRLVLAALGNPASFRLDLPINQLVMNDITVRGTVMGSSSLRRDIPTILALYRQGKYKLDELITHRFSLADIRKGYSQLDQGDVVRAVIQYN
ncbi:zinc-binding dehydrogenase [Glutamicibacter arilaitensis]|uniref:zinc-binding dehydrogenase n=1 Tax=Glutamicibacter arilaitensis TaxID=256701 RepID=UPI00384F881F